VAAFWDFNAAAFGERHVQIDLLVESGETVVMEGVAENKHTGPMAAIGGRRKITATGKTLVLPHVNMYTVRDRLIG
jgi:hypothetical protein